MNSIIESALSGTPLICVPLFADQFRNAQMVRNRGFGVIIDKHNMTKESLVDALKQVLFDKR
jgi:UDP:flavonoid glycosyltransferase YjiC (YdhE family)